MTARPRELLESFNKKAFMSYSVGVWVTAWARWELQQLIDIADATHFVYADTDSVKYIGEIDYSEYNNEVMKRSKANGAFAKDKSGKIHYMGIYEREHSYDKFITLGAKKYAYEIDGQTFVTCAGVNKKKGGIELEKAGGVQAFREGFTFTDAGGTESVYNDTIDEIIDYDGRQIHITPNVVIRPSTYTLGLTGEYIDILHKATRLYTLLWKEYPQLIKNYKTRKDL